jgi:predicted RNA binding protein YcfA (HicA-like mRNA interferase family)
VPRTVRDLVKLMEADGWEQVHQVGSHRQYKHPAKKGRVTISGKLSEDVHPKTERSILRQAGLIGGVQ